MEDVTIRGKFLKKKLKKLKSYFLSANKQINKYTKQKIPALTGPNDSGLHRRFTSNRQ